MTYQLPLKGKARLTCPFGKPGSWQAGFHVGIDLVGDASKNIYPVAPGVVMSINAHGSAYGKHVCVKQDDGNVSLYAHLAVVSVSKGQKVGPSTLLGREGSTGNSSGSHLHLEIHQGAYRYPPKGSSPAKCPWLLNPAELLGIRNEVGEVKKMADQINPSAWAKEAWEWAKQAGLLDGSRPKEPITREELAVIVYRLMNK